MIKRHSLLVEFLYSIHMLASEPHAAWTTSPSGPEECCHFVAFHFALHEYSVF